MPALVTASRVYPTCGALIIAELGQARVPVASTSCNVTRFKDVDGRDKCLVRGHGRHLFGDITDTFGVGQVDGCDLVGAEKDAVQTIGIARPNGYTLATEGLRHLPARPFEADVVVAGRDHADDLLLVILNLRQLVGHGPWAWPITGGRHVVVEPLMRSVEIINLSPSVEGVLHFGQVAEAPEGKHLGLQGAVEALVLAATLRVIGPAVDHIDAELQQPDGKPCPALSRGLSPGRSVVDKEAVRQSVMAECGRQFCLHRLPSFVGARRQAHRKARMVVHHRQGMATPLVAELNPALEVHLPKLIGGRSLEPLTRRSAPRRCNNATMTAQDRVHCRRRRTGYALAFEAVRDLPSPPRRMLIAQCHNARFDQSIRPRWARMGTTRAIGKL